MKLIKLTLNNFGTYCGETHLHLENNSKPIVLVGGKNGAGKTTILEALRLSLYGRMALGDATGEDMYHDYLRSKVHYNSDEEIVENFASVCIEFTYAESLVSKKYKVTRSWDISNKGLKPSLKLEIDGDEPLLEHKQIDAFLRKLIPPGVSQLYFFDGEKIQSLAEKDGDIVFADSVKTLFGLDMVERLQTDLTKFEMRVKDDKDDKATKKLKTRHNDIQNQIKEKNERIEEIQEGISDFVHRHQDTLNILEKAEERLISEGALYAESLAKFKDNLDSQMNEVEELSMQARNYSAGLLPFLIVPDLCQQLSEQLKQEATLQSWKSGSVIAKELVHDSCSELVNQIASISGGGLASTQIEACIKNVLGSMSNVPDELADVKVIHHLSNDQHQKALHGINELGNLRETLSDVRCRLEKSMGQILLEEENVAQTPDDLHLLPFKEDVDTLKEKKFVEIAERSVLDEDLRREFNILGALERDRDKIEKQIRQRTKGDENQQLITVTQRVLQRFREQLLESKVNHLAQAICSRLSQLWRKGDKVARIEICPSTFAITLFEHNDKVLPKSDLSSGEKQMYAVAVLWGLADVSGRPLPLVIDTPMGRLDSEHRRLLVEKYFPYASEQVIILSTDTEIDEEFLTVLRPHISHTISADHDIKGGFTNLNQGYFWDVEAVEVTDAAY
jgi:DNA sulfur modification protein DndD